MDLETVIEKRRSVRSFTGLTPPERDVRKILQAAEMAPSAGGLNARKILVIKGESKRNALSDAAMGQGSVREAPYVLVFCADQKSIGPYGERGRTLYCIQDASAAVENALLMITNLGMGGCWVGAFDENKVSEVCGLPDYLRPVALVPFGYEK